MKVYRNNIFIINHVSELPVKQIGNAWYNPSGHKVALHPQINTVIHTGADFEGYTNIRTGFNIQANSYYRFDGTKKARSRADQNLYAKWTNISAEQASALGRIAIFNIMEGTYTGKDMGERSIVATIDFPSRIDFQIGDYVEFEIANLERTTSIHGGSGMEKFYIYTMPTVKKVASRLSFGKAFQHTVTFYPCQYELATVKMRDVLQDISSGVIYTGYDEFSFYGGANTLMKRIMAVLDERFGHTGVAGKDYWSYQIADSINEDRNTALEKFQFDFSDSNVMEALLKLNDAEGINTKFFINERMIYVGFKRPYIVGVDEHNLKRDIPFEFAYGKTSQLPIETNHGNLYTITKSNGSASPITRLYAYGAERNLQRFYCSDRIKTGRYVNKLMLPSFEDDGRTDYIDSPEGIARFGILEGTKTFDNIYPSLRFFYYGNLRDVKYCIKLMGSGLESDADGVYDNGTMIVKTNITEDQLKQLQAEVKRYKDDSLEANTPCTITVDGKNYTITVAEADVLINSGKIRVGGGMKRGDYHYPIARIQCYRVEELLDGQGNHTGLNYLVESAPPVDLAVFCHATGKVVKCVLYAAKDGQSSTARQLAADGKIPTRTEGGTDYIVGSCFAVHDGHPTESNKHFECGHLHPSLAYPGLPNSDQRAAWFTDADSISTSKDGSFYKPYDEYKNQVSIHQIHYTDDHWITDVYEFTDYHQETFNRQGYSAYCWPRVNKYYPNSQADNIEVNAVVDVGPVLIEDTDLNTSQGQQQQTFDIYMRDMGFKINDQTWFGDKCFLFDTCKISFLDGNLGGYEFEMPAESDQDKLGSIYVPALAPDGARNPEFFDLADNPAQAEQAYQNGAFWRIVAKRAETEVDRYWVPNVNLNASAGDHVVFLDIFMPDLYIRVAEQRLYKEAKKYLDANDDGDIQYSFDFDKVRMLKQPTFPLQMREGAIMRVIDDDLDVGTVNAQKTLFEDKNGLVSSASMIKTTASVDEGIEIVTRDCDYVEKMGVDPADFIESQTQPGYHDYIVFGLGPGDSSYDLDLDSGLQLRLYLPTGWTKQGGTYVAKGYNVYYRTIRRDRIVDITTDTYGRKKARVLALHDIMPSGFFDGIYYTLTKVYVGYSIKKPKYIPVYDTSVFPQGRRIFCSALSLTDFKPSKYYELEIDVMEPSLAVPDTQDERRMFALVNGIGDAISYYYPEYMLEDITPEGADFTRYRVRFTLDESFNDDIDYYPSILYQSDGLTEAVHVRLWSIVERDDATMEDLNYVDLAIDTVTIKFHDNTREKDVSLQDGQEPERLRDNLSEMSREVSATVKEESRATAWAQLMDRVTEAEQLQDQTLDFYQSLVDASRKHYLELLNLKNNIFDPDGTCRDTFLQVMMLQVGADSMNYQLKYTHYSMNGHTANCKVEQGQSEQTDSTSGKLYRDQFKIGNAEEVLDHYVYTDHPTNGEGGRWYPQERNTTWNLHKIAGPDGADIYPVYFIALKASLTNPQDCHWVCEPTQHATNELVDAPNTQDRYFYFNWGILAPVTDNGQDPDYGKYTLTETRGNAYMYGDNLICGQISTLAGNSYFDLTHGNFVLSNGDESDAALSYINGVLTIKGLSDEDGIGKIIKDLGLEIENMEIGGENLYGGIDPLVLSGWKYTGIVLENGKKYVISIGDITGNALNLYAIEKDGNSYNDLCKIVDGRGGTSVTYKDTAVVVTGNGKELGFRCAANSGQSWTLSQIMVQKGNKPTTYNTYYNHLTNAIKGSTEIAGGLVMTNLLMLKDEDGKVKAGMSGLPDDRDYTYEDNNYTSQGVTLFGGGSYEDALMQAAGLGEKLIELGKRLLPVLITKTGVGSRIGCFYVEDENTVYIENPSRTEKITFDTELGITVSKRNSINEEYVDKIRIHGGVINNNAVSTNSFNGGRITFYDSTHWTSLNNSPFFAYPPGENEPLLLDSSHDYYSVTNNITALTVTISFTNYYAIVEPRSAKIRNVYVGLIEESTGRKYVLGYHAGLDASNIHVTSHTLNLSLRNINKVPAGVYKIYVSIGSAKGWEYTNYQGTEYDLLQVDNPIVLNHIDFTGGMLFSSQLENTITEIASNGIQISSPHGVTQILNDDNNNMYVVMSGLPNTPTSPGQVYLENHVLKVN